MPQDMPLISVIVPVYKVEPYLEKCVKSIQNQTYRNLEIILVDDGSPDRCGEICDKLAKEDARIKVIHQKNNGLAVARNIGLEIATGEYIGFVDSDDYIDEDMYACLLAAITAHHVNLVVCKAKIVADNSECFADTADAETSMIFSKQEALRHILLNIDNSVCNKMFDRSLIGTLRFPHGKIHGEDFLFVLQYLSRINGAAVLDCKMYNYVKRDNSITSSSFSKSSLDEIYVKDEIQKYIIQNYPDYACLANKWCLKARMNVIRDIMLSEDKAKWNGELASCFEYLKDNYADVRHELSCKERVEYFLQIYFRDTYPFIIKMALNLCGK